MQVGLRSGLIREAIQKNVPPLIVVLYVPEIPPKVNGFVTLSGGGGVYRKDHLVTLLRCHYWLGGENNVIANGGAGGEIIGRIW